MSRFSADDYASALRRHLPRGRAWSDDPGSPFLATLRGLTDIYRQSDADAVGLLADAFPVEPVDLLPEWESSLGLPDPCMAATPTLRQRQAAVYARFIAGGGLSRQHYIDFAAALGFTIEIVVYSTCRCRYSSMGDALYNEIWAFVWGVRILSSTSGLEPSVLLCELNSIKPAETTVILLT